MKALVTGATGFIGSHLVEALVQRGFQVRCLVRNKRHLGWVKDSPVEFVVGNCQERNSLKQGVKDVDQVFHLAGVTVGRQRKNLFRSECPGYGEPCPSLHRKQYPSQKIYLSFEPGSSRSVSERWEEKGIRPLRTGLALWGKQIAGGAIGIVPLP